MVNEGYSGYFKSGQEIKIERTLKDFDKVHGYIAFKGKTSVTHLIPLTVISELY